MIRETQKGVHLLGFFGSGITVAFSGREYDQKKRSLFLKEAGVHPENLVLLHQVHSANLVMVSPEKRPDAECKADGMLTKTRGLALGILTADCVPIFFYDSGRQAIGIAHAGWRGIYHGIAKKMVQALKQNFLTNPAELKVILGPAIRACCYEVGEEFADFFPEFYKPLKEAKIKTGSGIMDLIGAIQSELEAEGVSAANIHDTGICTHCSHDRFFSFRKDKTPERILSLISLI